MADGDYLPQVVVIPRADHEAREWADLALASATELELQLGDERAAHAATRVALEAEQAALAAERGKVSVAAARIASTEAALGELRDREAETVQNLDRALSERWRLEEELGSMVQQANAVDAHRAQAVRDLAAVQADHAELEKLLGEREATITVLEAKVATSAGALLRQVEQRNVALEANARLTDELTSVQAQLERIREALG
ncbi:MAG: hypothetical protein JWO22_3479 [Frankiales bacterium]|nr:hypothetical protein [Frankiales bacterium]